MGDDEKSISGIPISGALAIVALIVGFLVIPQEPFKASRPNIPVKLRSVPHGGEDVQARLWQDPFSAVKIHTDDIPSNPPSHGHKVADLAEQITRKAGKKNEEIVVLGVMVSGGPYAEDVEARTRYRYAALSALGELDYVPDDSEHIGYLENLAFNVNSGDSSLPPFSMYKLVELIEPERPSACLAMTFDHTAIIVGLMTYGLWMLCPTNGLKNANQDRLQQSMFLCCGLMTTASVEALSGN